MELLFNRDAPHRIDRIRRNLSSKTYVPIPRKESEGKAPGFQPRTAWVRIPPPAPLERENDSFVLEFLEAGGDELKQLGRAPNVTSIFLQRFQDSELELFGRLTYNILCGNTDDHACNHAAFWDGKNLRLTPAYDVCPQSRAGEEAGQGMRIFGNNNASQLALCLKAAPQFLLSDQEARTIILEQVNTIRARWDSICDEAKLSAADRALLYGRQFLNPFAFYDAPQETRAAGQL